MKRLIKEPGEIRNPNRDVAFHLAVGFDQGKFAVLGQMVDVDLAHFDELVGMWLRQLEAVGTWGFKGKRLSEYLKEQLNETKPG